MSDSQNDGPWRWHIEETFKGLIALSIEALKALLLINGGAAVAILAYLGSLASRGSGAHLPDIKNALLCYAGGVFTTALAFIVAYFYAIPPLLRRARASYEAAIQYASLDWDRDRHRANRLVSASFRRWLLSRCVSVSKSAV